ncbi:MAG: MoxR family ATPase [Fuerstiella sp.]
MTDASTTDSAINPEQLKQQLNQFRTDFADLTTEVGKVIVGQKDVVRGTLIALIAGGHVLLEGVPGLGKTMLVRTLAEAMHLQFSRVQFTPDLMPADLLGTSLVVDHADGSKRFEFQKGPVFANVLLADEINRATPKTQSALLEAMAERSVTVAGQSMSLPSPFLVLATQNPLEMEGTYPLPEAQLDRFFVNLMVQYPSAAEMSLILNQTTGSSESIAKPVIDGDRILEMRKVARQIIVGQDVQDRAIAIVMGTHPDQPTASAAVKRFVRYGASPRGAQALILYAKILAVLDDRYNVSFEDIRQAAPDVLRHRMILGFEGQAEGVSTDDALADLLNSFEK